MYAMLSYVQPGTYPAFREANGSLGLIVILGRIARGHEYEVKNWYQSMEAVIPYGITKNKNPIHLPPRYPTKERK